MQESTWILLAKEVLDSALRRWGMVVLVAGPLSVGAFAVNRWRPKVFAASAAIMPSSSDAAGGGGLAAAAAGLPIPLNLPGTHPPQQDVLVAILKSRVLRERVIAKFDLLRVYDKRSLEVGLDELSRGTKIVVGKDRVIHLTVEAPQAQLAADLANFHIEELDRINKRFSSSKASQTRHFLEGQLVEAKQRLAAAEDHLRDFQSKHRALSMDSQSRALLDAGTTLESQLTAQEIQLQAARSYLSDDNPEVARLRSVVDGMRRKIQQLDTGKGRSGNLRPALTAVPALMLDYGRLLREVRIQEQVFSLLTTQLEEAKISEARDTSTLQVLDPAVIPERRIRPTVVKDTLLMSFLAGVLAVGLAFVLERRRRRRAPSEGSEHAPERPSDRLPGASAEGLRDSPAKRRGAAAGS